MNFRVFSILLLLLLLPVLFTSCNSTIEYEYPFPKSDIDLIAEDYIDADANFGLAVGTFSGGKTSLNYYGIANDETGKKVGKNTLFELGSVSKVFTSTILAEMVNEGLVRLNDPVEKFLPFGLSESKNGKMTLLHLATHTASLPRVPGNLYAYNPFTLPKQRKNPYARYTINDMYTYLRDEFKPEAAYGSSYRYSELGFSLLGAALSNVEGRDYATQLSERVLKPLRLHGVCLEVNSECRADLATPHDYRGNPTNHWDYKAIAPAGGLKSTLTDMVMFLAANLGEGDADVVSALSLAQQLQYRVPDGAKDFSFGLGWVIMELGHDNLHVTEQNGGTGGFRSYIGFVPETRTGVVVLSNSSTNVDSIAHHILRVMNGEELLR